MKVAPLARRPPAPPTFPKREPFAPTPSLAPSSVLSRPTPKSFQELVQSSPVPLAVRAATAALQAAQLVGSTTPVSVAATTPPRSVPAHVLAAAESVYRDAAAAKVQRSPSDDLDSSVCCLFPDLPDEQRGSKVEKCELNATKGDAVLREAELREQSEFRKQAKFRDNAELLDDPKHLSHLKLPDNSDIPGKSDLLEGEPLQAEVKPIAIHTTARMNVDSNPISPIVKNEEGEAGKGNDEGQADEEDEEGQASPENSEEHSDFIVDVPQLEIPEPLPQMQSATTPTPLPSTPSSPPASSAGETQPEVKQETFATMEIKREASPTTASRFTSAGRCTSTLAKKKKRKTQLRSEIFRLQKALETASWTDSVAIQAQTDVVIISDDESPPKTPSVPKSDRILRRPTREMSGWSSAVRVKSDTAARSTLRSGSEWRGRPSCSKIRQENGHIARKGDPLIQRPRGDKKSSARMNSIHNNSNANSESARKTSLRQSKTSSGEESMGGPHFGANDVQKSSRDVNRTPLTKKTTTSPVPVAHESGGITTRQASGGRTHVHNAPRSTRSTPKTSVVLDTPRRGKKRKALSENVSDAKHTVENTARTQKRGGRKEQEMLGNRVLSTPISASLRSRTPKQKHPPSIPPSTGGKMRAQTSSKGRKTVPTSFEKDLNRSDTEWVCGEGETKVVSKKRRKGRPRKLTDTTATTDVLAESRAELHPTSSKPVKDNNAARMDDELRAGTQRKREHKAVQKSKKDVVIASPLRRGRSQKSVGLTAADVGIRTTNLESNMLAGDADGFAEASDGEEVAPGLNRNDWNLAVEGWIVECKAMRESWHDLTGAELSMLLCSPLGFCERAAEIIPELRVSALGKKRGLPRRKTGKGERHFSDTERTESSCLLNEDINRKTERKLRNKHVK